jgi:hypothetical protein
MATRVTQGPVKRQKDTSIDYDRSEDNYTSTPEQEDGEWNCNFSRLFDKGHSSQGEKPEPERTYVEKQSQNHHSLRLNVVIISMASPKDTKRIKNASRSSLEVK